MKPASLSVHDRDIARIRRKRLLVGALYVLACLLPAGTFLVFILTQGSAR